MIISIIKVLFFIVFVIVITYVYIRQQPYTYYIHDSKIDPMFKKKVRYILQNSNWRKYFNIQEVKKPTNRTIQIYLEDRKKLAYLHKEGEPWFSYTIQNEYLPPKIYIDHLNWINGVKKSGLTLNKYREYLINHEFGHALGFAHQPCGKKVCPVMYQATRGPPNGQICATQPTDIDLTKKISNAYKWY